MRRFATVLTVLATLVLGGGCWESRKTPEQNNQAEDQRKLNSSEFTASGSQVVPSVTTNTSAWGRCGLFSENKSQVLDVLVGIKNLSSPISAAHFHVAPSGQSGPVVFDFPRAAFVIEDSGATVSVQGSWKVTSAQLSSLKAGKVYFDVHTTAQPNGEVRAQIPVAPGW